MLGLVDWEAISLEVPMKRDNDESHTGRAALGGALGSILAGPLAGGVGGALGGGDRSWSGTGAALGSGLGGLALLKGPLKNIRPTSNLLTALLVGGVLGGGGAAGGAIGEQFHTPWYMK